MPDNTRSTRPTAAANRPSRSTAPAASPVPAPSELVVVDPKQLLTAANVRAELKLTPEFVDSIRQHGVLEPITARRDAAGALWIERGHRRAAAAAEAGLAAVRVLVEAGLPAAADDNSAAAGRLVTQLVENDQRAAVAAGDRINAYSQLAAFGLKVGDIAKTTGAKKGDVDKALAVAGNDLASKATARYDLTLDEAFVVSDFAGDKDGVKALIAAKKTGQFDHVAQRLRDRRDKAAAQTSLRKALTDRGVTILDGHPGDKGGVRLSQLKHAGKVLDEAGHAGCDYRAAYISETYDERHVAAVEVCTDPVKAGHKPRYGEQIQAPSGPSAGGLSEAQKQERRDIRENNTAWRSAETVRRQFLATLMAGAGKTLPPGSRKFIAESIAGGDHALRRSFEGGHALARDLLKLKSPSALHTAVSQASDNKAELLTLGLVLSAYEASTDVHTWRHPSPQDSRYFGFLRAAGYALAPVEEKVAGRPAKTNPASPGRPAVASARSARAGWSPKTKRPTAAGAAPVVHEI